MTIDPNSSTLALRVSAEIHANGLDAVILVSPTHKPDWVWIGFTNRDGAARRQAALGTRFIDWLNAKPRTAIAARIELERKYHLYLHQQRANQQALYHVLNHTNPL